MLPLTVTSLNSDRKATKIKNKSSTVVVVVVVVG